MCDLASALPQTADVCREGIENGQHRGVQVSVSRNSRVIADAAIGEASPGVPMTSQTLLPWLSAGKPLTAVCILRRIESGQLSLETPVAQVIPEFSATSSTVTIRHLLTHTAGINEVRTGWPTSDWDDVIARICTAGLRDEWVPGERAAYDPTRSWYLLGEIIRRTSGQPIEQVVRKEVMVPLGMRDSWMAWEATTHDDYGERIGRTWIGRAGQQEPTEGHTLAFCSSPSPGASCRGPAGDLRLLYEMLLAGGVGRDGDRILQAETVRLMTRRHREGMYDETFRHRLDFGLGVIVNSRRYGADTVPYGYGEEASEETFGHGGARSCLGFADPQSQLVVCVIANGYLTEPQHQLRMRRILAALNADLSESD